MVIINPLAHAVEILMVKSESRWTALTTALNHPLAKLMIHGWIFVPLMAIILADLDHFKQKLLIQNKNRDEYSNESWNTSMHTICLKVQNLQN